MIPTQTDRAVRLAQRDVGVWTANKTTFFYFKNQVKKKMRGKYTDGTQGMSKIKKYCWKL